MSDAPLEIMVSPAEVYLAAVGTAFPDVDAVPGAGWTLVGTAGSDNYTEDGVTIRRTLSTQEIRALKSTVPRKIVRTQVGFEVEFNVMDLNPEEMAYALGADDGDITDTAAASGVAGNKAFDIPTDPTPVHKAILVRVPASALGDGWNSQYEIVEAVQVGPGELVHRKDGAATVRHLWRCLKDSSGNFVTFREQTADAL